MGGMTYVTIEQWQALVGLAERTLRQWEAMRSMQDAGTLGPSAAEQVAEQAARLAVELEALLAVLDGGPKWASGRARELREENPLACCVGIWAGVREVPAGEVAAAMASEAGGPYPPGHGRDQWPAEQRQARAFITYPGPPPWWGARIWNAVMGRGS